MNRTLHNLSYVSTSKVGTPPGIEPDGTAHAFLGGQVARSGATHPRAARSLTVAPGNERKIRSSPTKNP
ncbi:hypothetical protein A33K_18527 [Burkholderia humptydooensis MSMB43]|uniref:Uncharacterized protein n=1 Tax=Burkholderia humptydooensis MSMB43 TaxID=441157 RepID=A0ABN0FY96_9BURK|nr:hypothetical protein A33K_18527 [Burkholderia humptydooensis MSMB43]